MTGAEGAGLERLVLESLGVEHKGIRSLGSSGGDDDPPTRKRVQAHLCHLLSSSVRIMPPSRLLDRTRSLSIDDSDS